MRLQAESASSKVTGQIGPEGSAEVPGPNVWQQDGFAPIRAAWLARAHPPGSTLGVRLADRFVTGQFVGIDADGALLLDTPQGRGRIVAGNVKLEAVAPVGG